MAEDKDISMETRVLIAFALSALVLLLYAPIQKRFFPTPAPPAKETPAQPAAKGQGQPQGQPAATPAPAAPAAAAPAAPAAPAKPSAPPVAGVRQASQESETVVENDLYRVVFWNRGAVVKSWTLKRYRDNHGKPLELVNQSADAGLGYPFQIWVDDDTLREELKNALFAVRATATKAPATVTFEYSDGTVSVRKEFRFQHASYVAEVSSQLHNGADPVPHELAWRGGFGDQTVLQSHGNTNIVTATPEKVERHAYSSIKTETKFSGPFVYGGIEDLFFASVFMPPADAPSNAGIATVRTFRSNYQPEGQTSSVVLVGVGVGGAAQNQLRVFVGPKALDVLESVHPEPLSAQKQRQGQPVMTLGELLDFGWFSIIAKPLFLGLKWLYGNVVANYGWDIVLLTIFINLALFPLKLKSMRSALKMQKVAPQIRVIQEKYKKYKFNDPRKQQQNQEIMALYKQYGINPIGGCFPMLIQIPFLYAFYRVLAISIEMRHAPWIGWIHDLSARDPYYILPIIMTLTMFVLQKMTPQTTTDPAQAKMFQFMPLIFGFMFMNFSCGLVLYWLVGNLVGILQQWYINKVGLAPAAPPASRKPALVK